MIESQISMFIVQSGPINRSLVAFSTRTVAEADDISVAVRFPSNKERTIETLDEKRKGKRELTKKGTIEEGKNFVPSVR